MVVLLATSDVIGRKMGEPKISDDGNPSIKETSSDDKNDSPDDKDAGVVNGRSFLRVTAISSVGFYSLPEKMGRTGCFIYDGLRLISFGFLHNVCVFLYLLEAQN